MKYTDPDGRIYYIGNEAFVLNPKQENKIYSSLLKKLLGFALIGLGNFLDKGGGVAIAAAVTGVTGGTGAVTAPAIVAGSAVLGKVLEVAGTAIILASCAEDISSSNVQYSSNGKDRKTNHNDVQKQRETAPKKGIPSGTRPLDKAKIPKGSHNKIKEGVGNGPKDWTGIAPNGDVIINDGYGNAVNCGPYTDYL